MLNGLTPIFTPRFCAGEFQQPAVLQTADQLSSAAKCKAWKIYAARSNRREGGFNAEGTRVISISRGRRIRICSREQIVLGQGLSPATLFSACRVSTTWLRNWSRLMQVSTILRRPAVPYHDRGRAPSAVQPPARQRAQHLDEPGPRCRLRGRVPAVP